MCLIFLKEKDQEPITEAWCQEVFTRNNDGWGLTYVNSAGEMRVRKGLQFKNFWTIFNLLQQKDIDVLVHMRMATQGVVKDFNIHPFMLGDTGIAFMHNGMCSYPDMEEDFAYEMAAYGRSWSWSDESDTKQLADKFLTPLLSSMKDPNDFIRTKEFAWILDQAAGKGNKFALTDNKGHVLVNQAKWSKTTKGMWVSNTYAFTTDKVELPSKAVTSLPSSRPPTVYTNMDGKEYIMSDGQMKWITDEDYPSLGLTKRFVIDSAGTSSVLVDRSGCVVNSLTQKKVG